MHRPSMYGDLAVMFDRRIADDSESQEDEALAIGTAANAYETAVTALH